MKTGHQVSAQGYPISLELFRTDVVVKLNTLLLRTCIKFSLII